MSDVLGHMRGIAAALPDRIESVAFAPDGSAVAATTDKGTFVVDAATGATRRLGATGGKVVWGPCGVVAVSHDRVKRFSVGVTRDKASGEALVARTKDRTEVELFGEDGALLRTLPIAGSEVAVAAGSLAVFEGMVRMHDPVTGAERSRVEAPHVYYIALSPDGSRVVATGRDGSWEGPTAGPLQWYPEGGNPAHGGSVFAIGGSLFLRDQLTPFASVIAERIAFSPVSDLVCIAHAQQLRILARADLAAAPPIVGPRETVKVIAVDEARGRLAATDETGVTCIWRLDDASLVSAFRAGSGGLAWAQDGSLLVGGRGVSVWDAETGQRRRCVPLHDLEDTEQVFVRGDRVFVRGRWQVAVLDADLNRLTTLGPWPGERYGNVFLSTVEIGRDGAIAYVARQDMSTLAIPVAGGEPTVLAEAQTIAATDQLVALSRHGEASLLAHSGEIRPLDGFSQATAVDGGVIVADGQRVTLHTWDGPGFEARFRDDVHTLAASRKHFYTSGNTSWIAERQLDDGRLRRVFASGGGGKVIALAFDPSGDRLAVGEMEGRLHVWSLSDKPERIGILDGTTLQPAGTIREPSSLSLEAVAFPGDLVAGGSTAMVWSAADLAVIGTTEPRRFGEYAKQVSRDGTLFITGGEWGNELIAFDAEGEKFRAASTDTRDRFKDISDDGALVLVGGVTETSSEMTVYGRGGERIGTLRVDGRVQYAGFSSAGDVLGWTEEKGPFFRWKLAAGVIEKWCEPPVASRWSSSFVRGGGRLAIRGEVITIVDEQTGAQHATIPTRTRHGATAVALSDDGRRIALGSWHGIVHVYDLTGALPRCTAELSTTQDSGWWAAGAGGFTHVRGEAATRKWSEP